jgi:hypothetical protein
VIEKENNVHDIEELTYHNNFQLCYDILSKWHKAKPTKEMVAVHKAFTEISIYVMHMQQRQRQYDQQISEWRASRNRAILRAREAEDELQTLKSKRI